MSHKYYAAPLFSPKHFTSGLFLSCVFQPAHIMETSPFLAPVDTDGKQRMKDSWAIHEVVNTTNFAPNNRILSWFIGGLNYQIEHHLFTNICHVHYKKISSIVKDTLEAFQLPYHVQPTFIISQMPVQNIVLVADHVIDKMFDLIFCEKMPRYIKH